jgi:hypothetical protein
MRAGAVYLTEDRKSNGLLLEETIATNLTLAALNKFQRGPLVDQAKESRALDEATQSTFASATRTSSVRGNRPRRQAHLLCGLRALFPDKRNAHCRPSFKGRHICRHGAIATGNSRREPPRHFPADMSRRAS